VKVKSAGFALIFFLIAAISLTACTYLMTMKAWNPHSQYDGQRPWATPWKSQQ
jgi:hypothetical protein